MKKLLLIITSLLMLHTGTAFADNDKPITVNQLPQAAQELISQHFAGKKVAFAKMETEIMSKSYEVIFTNGEQIDFDSKGNWKEIECKQSAVPTALIPKQIMNYVKTNYPDERIIKIEKDRREYEVKLSNRMELKFDMKFNLIDIDM